MHKTLFGRHGVIPDLQRSHEWQARFIAMQKQATCLGIGHEFRRGYIYIYDLSFGYILIWSGQESLTVCAEPEQQGLDQQGLYVKGPKPYLCSYLANFVFICFVLSFFVFICLFCFYLSLFVFICFCLSFICNCLLLFYLGPGFVLYVYNTSPRPQSALV